MEETIRQFLEKFSDEPSWSAYLFFALSSALEYIFPPFPGDTITLSAALLIGAKNWPFLGMFLAINLGSMAGAIGDYWIGRWLGGPGHKWRQRGPRWKKLGDAIDRTAERFQRHGLLYLALNRFFPSIRALFFVAAGAAKMAFWKVVTFGLISSVAWNLLILLVGRVVGYKWEQLAPVFKGYGLVLWSILAVVFLFFLIRWLIRRRKHAGRNPRLDETLRR